MSAVDTKHFDANDAELVLRNTTSDDDASLAQLCEEYGVQNVDDLLLVYHLQIDPVADGLSLSHELKKLGLDQISLPDIVRKILDGRLSSDQKLQYEDLLSRDQFRDGDQGIIEDLFDELRIVRGDLKQAIIALAVQK